MSRNPNASNVSRRKFLAVTGSFAAASSFAVGREPSLAPALTPPPAAADYPVVIDLTVNPVTYKLQGSTANAYRLKAAVKKTITWKVNTPNSNPHCVAIFFPSNTPFLDENDRPLYAALWTEYEEGAKPITLTIDPDTPAGTYDYFVAVFDRKTGYTFVEDPKIIVGSGGVDASSELALAREQLAKAERLDIGLKDKIRPIEEALERLIRKPY